MCVDLLNPDPDPEAGNGRSRRSFEPDEICWNIDRCDESGLPPFDGEYCPPVEGIYVNSYFTCLLCRHVTPYAVISAHFKMPIFFNEGICRK